MLDQDRKLIPSAGICGAPLTATRTEVVNTLGEPDGLINIGADRVGLLYPTLSENSYSGDWKFYQVNHIQITFDKLQQKSQPAINY